MSFLFSSLSLLFCSITSFSSSLDDLKLDLIYSVGNFGLSSSSYKLINTSVKFSTKPAFSKYFVNSSLFPSDVYIIYKIEKF